jgi:hypothetical protein
VSLARARQAVLLAALVAGGCHGDLRFIELTTCAGDQDCLLPSLHCSAGRCVACTSDAHCASPTPRCDLAIHRCIECGVTSDCAGDAVCKTGHCEVQCPAACPAATPICDDEACVECDQASDCAASPKGPLCVRHVCSACLADADCGGASPRCDPVTQQCVACQQNDDCPAATPLCDPVRGRCLAVP